MDWLDAGHFFSVSQNDAFHEITFEGIIRLKSFEHLHKIFIIIIPLERVTILGILSCLIVGHLRATELLGHQGLLLKREEATVEVAKTNRVCYNFPDVELGCVKASKLLHRSQASMLAEALSDEVEHFLLEAYAHLLRLLYRAFKIVYIIKGFYLTALHFFFMRNSLNKLLCLLFFFKALLFALAGILCEV